MNKSKGVIKINISSDALNRVGVFFERNGFAIVAAILSVISVLSFMFYFQNGLSLAYNDARSHLDIGRRVVEGLKPGFAQLGSVWLPLTHLLMVLTIWNDFMWHSGLAGTIWSMFGFVLTGLIIYKFLEKIGVKMTGRLIGVGIFASNLNVLYLQSTAMTELTLVAAMTAGAYYLMLWFKDDKVVDLVKSAFWIMLSTLVRYDGWLLLVLASMMIVFYVWKKNGYKQAEGKLILFITLAGLGIVLWFLWNLLIFGDPLYFAFGPYSARTQQTQLEAAGVLSTKGDWFFSLKVYFYALAYNSNAFLALMGLVGAVALWFSGNIRRGVRFATFVLLAPLFFNILALYLGHSVLFIQGLSGDTWFNARYGVMLMPTIAIFVGYLIHYVSKLRPVIIGLILFVLFFQFSSGDAVTIDDARVGSSQKNVAEVSGWLAQNAAGKDGFVLISAASHDAIIFSSGMPMKKFIHEGTGDYWKEATTLPDHWARWIVMRTHDDNDSVWSFVSRTPGFERYDLVDSYPFADIYQLRDEYLDILNTEPILENQD